MTPPALKPHQTHFFRDAMMIHGVRMDCCLANNAYFIYWQNHSARNKPHRWRWFFDKNPNHFQVVAQPNSRTFWQLQFLRQFDFVRMWARIISQNSPRRHRDTQRLRSTCERHIWAFFNWSLSGRIFSTLRALLCLTGTGTFCTVGENSNFSTRCWIVDLLGRLLRP